MINQAIIVGRIEEINEYIKENNTLWFTIKIPKIKSNERIIYIRIKCVAKDNLAKKILNIKGKENRLFMFLCHLDFVVRDTIIGPKTTFVLDVINFCYTRKYTFENANKLSNKKVLELYSSYFDSPIEGEYDVGTIDEDELEEVLINEK